MKCTEIMKLKKQQGEDQDKRQQPTSQGWEGLVTVPGRQASRVPDNALFPGTATLYSAHTFYILFCMYTPLYLKIPIKL